MDAILWELAVLDCANALPSVGFVQTSSFQRVWSETFSHTVSSSFNTHSCPLSRNHHLSLPVIPFLNFLITDILLPRSLLTSFLRVDVTAAGGVFIVPHTLLIYDI